MVKNNDELKNDLANIEKQDMPKTRGITINHADGERVTIIEFLDKGPIVVEDEPELV